jgi:hypothetical protein
MLAAIGFWFTAQQDARQQRIEDQRAESALTIQQQNAQDEALQAYLDQMTQLILDRKLLEAEQGDPLYTLAQARTSTVILRLDAEHNESVARFLINSGLAVSSEASAHPEPNAVASAAPSDVFAFPETSARLLREITLSHATLSDAYLPNADLSDAHLIEADLSGANLSGGAHLNDAILSGADLSGANLSGANLSGADLRETYLVETNLSDTDLSGANLRDARGVTDKQLLQAKTLEGATMPDGSIHD